jgi:hypothetical protein
MRTRVWQALRICLVMSLAALAAAQDVPYPRRANV